jgi:F-type H+-transporting ATPase subunit gamma
VKVLSVGRKGAAFLKREFPRHVVGEMSFMGKKRIGFEDASAVADRITTMLEAGEFDVCSLLYNRFQSVITQIATDQRLIPAQLPEVKAADAGATQTAYEYEPAEEQILATLLPRNLAIQVYRALLENNAGFYGSQMNAMDNATRNAGEMINKLTLNYNRTRQANITRELIEIISGAEAV